MPTITISNRTITVMVLLALGVAAVIALREVIILVFVSLVLATALNPTISMLARRRISRRWGAAIVLIGVAVVLILLAITIVPAVSAQLSEFLTDLPSMLSRISSSGLSPSLVSRLSASGANNLGTIFSHLGSGIFNGALGLFAGLLSAAAMVAMMYYFTIDERGIRAAAMSLAPLKYHPVVSAVVSRIEQRLGKWLRGQLFLGLVIGTLSTIGLLLLHVKYAFALGLIAGVTELIPTVGPYLGMLPAILVGFTMSPLTALWVFLLYWAIQQSENNFLVPRIMSKATGLNPIAVLVGILVGAKLAGILGILLSIPTVIIISTIGETFLSEREGEIA